MLKRVCKRTNAPWCISERRRSVSKWSPLASAFNSKPERKLRLSQNNVGLFGIPQLTDYTGFYLLQEGAKFRAEELVEEATSVNRDRKLVQVFDDLSDCLCQVADMADFVRVAHPDHSYAKAAEEACVSVSALVEKMNTNTHIHKALKRVIMHGDNITTDNIDDRVAKLFMFDFEQSGIHLEEAKRKTFVDLNELILMQGSYFMQGCHRPVNIRKSDLAPHLRDVFTMEGNISISGLFSDHPNSLIREACYKVYLQQDERQANILDCLLESRNDLANLVGFGTYRERALKGTMSETPENVAQFLDGLADCLRPKAEEDFSLLRQMKVADGCAGDRLQPWDTAYYSGMARQAVSELSSAEYSAYFSLGTCMDGLSQLLQALYGVTLQPSEPQPGEVWSTDVRTLAVVHETDGVLGRIYCDLFERPGKAHTDCHFTIRGGRCVESEDGGVGYQSPVVVLMLNLPAARNNEPALLPPAAVENLFHEFGHAMHSMLGRTRYQHVTGTRCPTDFAEVPSVLMEYFANDPRVIASFARHWRTGERMPAAQIARLCRVRRMFGAADLQLQLFYAAVDQRFHAAHPLGGDTTQVLREVQRQYYGLPHVSGTAWHLRFGHFVGYGAKYYSYLMARAVASRIWHKCFAADPFSRSMGQQYCDTLLALGGSRHPTELVQTVLGECPTNQTLVNSLMDDLQCSKIV